MPLWTPTAEPQMQFAVCYRAAADLPQTALGPLFAVGGGLVFATIMGRVTTGLGATSNSAKFVADPTTGNDSDMSTNVDINAMALGKWLYPGGPTTATRISTSAGTSFGTSLALNVGYIHAIGNVSLNTTANQTGQMEFWFCWLPLEEGAYVVSV